MAPDPRIQHTQAATRDLLNGALAHTQASPLAARLTSLAEVPAEPVQRTHGGPHGGSGGVSGAPPGPPGCVQAFAIDAPATGPACVAPVLP